MWAEVWICCNFEKHQILSLLNPLLWAIVDSVLALGNISRQTKDRLHLSGPGSLMGTKQMGGAHPTEQPTTSETTNQTIKQFAILK